MLESVGKEVPDDDISKAVFYLIKEVGLSHEEIFGSTKYVSFVDTVGRDCILGDKLDYIFGEKKVETTEKVEARGMSLKAFAAYMELLKEHNEEKEKQQKKEKMRNSVKSTTFG